MLRGISRSYPSPSWKLGRSIRTFSTPVSITDDVTTGDFINLLAGNNPTLLGPVADATTKPILDAIIEMTNDPVSGLVLFTVLLRSLGQLSVYKSMKLEIEELKRRENYLDKKLESYHWLDSRNNVMERLPYRMTGNQFVVDRLFHPKHPERIKYDLEISSKSKYKFWGPLTRPKIVLPNLMPIPLFILGAISSRSLVSSTVTDISGMSFALDTSLFWMESLATPNTTMAVIAATSGFISFHLTQCHRTDFNVKRKYQNVSEVLFYSPDNPNMYQLQDAKNRENCRNEQFMYALFEPVSISKGFTALGAGGFGLMAFWFSNFVPAIVPLYTSIYFIMRILFEMLLFSNFGRNQLLSYPHYAAQTEMNPIKTLLRRACFVNMNNFGQSGKQLETYQTLGVTDHYAKAYKIYEKKNVQKKYLVKVKKPLLLQKVNIDMISTEDDIMNKLDD